MIRQRLQRPDQPRAVGDRKIAQPAEMDREQRQRHGAAGEGLGRDDGDLRPGMQIDALAAFARDRAADDVDDAQHAAALALDLLHRRQGVERLARLADGDVERVPLDHGIAVAELRCRLGMAGNARERLDQVRADRAGKIRRAAAQDLHAPHVEQVARGERDAAEMRGLEARHPAVR